MDLPVPRHESQDETVEWCNETFPQARNVSTRFINLLEEVVELGLAMGVTPEQMIAKVEIVGVRSASTFCDHTQIPGEIADVQISNECLASEYGLQVADVKAVKMGINRSRPKSYYEAKMARKRELGLN